MSWTERLRSRFGLVGELLDLLWRDRLWWMIPFVLVLLAAGLLIALSGSPAVAPFVYTLF